MKNGLNVVFLILPQVHLIDLAGPVQVFFEANQFGGNFQLQYCGISPTTVTKQLLSFCDVPHFEEVMLNAGDFLFIPGIDFEAIKEEQLLGNIGGVKEWIQEQYHKGVNICSVCSGTFVLAASKILKHKVCTSHWKCIDYLKKHYPDTQVVNDRLFVKDGNIYTSAGMTTGIDLALVIVEELLGPVVTSKIAREMVVYIRRSGDRKQESIYLDFRTHIHPAIHQVQDYIAQHPEQKYNIIDLAEMVHMSERNLTRLFKKQTGISIADFRTRCRLEHAQALLKNPAYTIDYVASQCGFSDARQFRRLWNQYYGKSPAQPTVVDA